MREDIGPRLDDLGDLAGPTPFQEAQQALRDALFDARDGLEERHYRALLHFAAALVELELARLDETP